MFVHRECPAELHDYIDRVHLAVCGVATPLPPSPPHSPPTPPMPPAAPPPPAGVRLRSAQAEQPFDPDCEVVTYDQCKQAAQKMAAADPLTSPVLDVSTAHCEGAETETASCFLGCALGDPSGAHALYHVLLNSEFESKHSKRCADNALHPMCLCAAPLPPPPPSDEPEDPLLQDYRFAGVPTKGSFSAQSTGYYRAAAIDSVLPSDFVSTTHVTSCPASDSGAAQCTRLCSSDLGMGLKAFQIKATPTPPSPPLPSQPPAPPSPPPSPRPPISTQRFHGATDGCINAGIYDGTECRDGGVGSVFPPVCDYGSSHTLCGPRPDVGNNAVIGDNSCASANNGVCEDGGAGSLFTIDADARAVSLCSYAQDQSDCPLRRVTYGPMTFSSAQSPPVPAPPLTKPGSPPPTPPPFTFVSCAVTCSYTTICSDGGLNSYLVDGAFMCNYGTQVQGR